MPTLAELEVWIKANDADLKKGLNALDKRLDKFEQDTEKKINRAGEAFDGFGNKATQAGQALAPLAAIIAGTAGYAVKVAADYQQMGNVFASVSQASVAEMEQVRQKALELGSDLALPGTSAKDAMAVMVELSKAGLDVAESIDAARGSIMLAAAGQLENARAAEIQANAMNSFNLAGREAGRVADVLSQAANASSAGVEDLAQAFAMGSSTAYAAKLTIEEYTASLAAMANAGIKGSDSGTSIKTMLMSLMAPADDAKRAMDSIGLSFFDAEGAARPFRDVIRDLREGIGGLSEAEQADIMKTIFGTDGIRAAQIITRLGDGFDTLVEQMEGAKGSAGKTASAMNGGLKGALDALQSSVQTLLLAEGEKGLPALERTVRSLAEGVTRLGNLPDPLKNLVVGAAALVAISAPVLMAVGSVSTGIGSLLASVQSLTGAIGVGGAAAGAGATAGGATAVAASGSLAASLAVLAGVVLALAATAATAALAIQNDWGGAGKAFKEVSEQIREDVTQVIEIVQDFESENRAALQKVGEMFEFVLGSVVRITLEDFGRRADQAMNMVRVMAEVFKLSFDLIKDVVIVTGNGFELFRMYVASAMSKTRQIVLATAAGIVDAVRAMIGAFSPVAGTLADALGLSGISEQLKEWAATAGSAADSIANSANKSLAVQRQALDYTIEAINHVRGGARQSTGNQGGSVVGRGAPPSARSISGNFAPGTGSGSDGGLVAPVDPFKSNDLGATVSIPERVESAWTKALQEIQKQADEARRRISDIGRDLEDQISLERFGKVFADLTSAENRQGVYELAMVMRELEEKNQKIAAEAKAETWLKDLAEAAEIAKDPVLQIAKNLGFTLDEWKRLSKGIQDELVGQALLQQMANLGSMTLPDIAAPGAEASTGKTGNPFWWAEGALPIIRQINETHQEYLAGLAHENAMILANSEAERIRLDLIQQYPSWTADMVDQAVSAALDVEATRQKADEIQDIIYRLTNWIDGSLDALLDDGFRGFFDEVVNGFTDMVADMAKAWIMSQMQGLFQDLLGGLISTGGKGSSGKNASGSLPFIKGSRASGGPVDGGMPYLVGERGPEIIIPQASGHVYNNSETVSLLKAINSKQSSSLSSKVDGETTVNNVTQPVVVNLTINANDAGSFYGSERQMKQMIAQAVKDGLRR